MYIYISNTVNSSWPSIFVSVARYVALGEREVSTNGNRRTRRHVVLIPSRRQTEEDLFSPPLRLVEGYRIVCLVPPSLSPCL